MAILPSAVQEISPSKQVVLPFKSPAANCSFRAIALLWAQEVAVGDGTLEELDSVLVGTSVVVDLSSENVVVASIGTDEDEVMMAEDELDPVLPEDKSLVDRVVVGVVTAVVVGKEDGKSLLVEESEVVDKIWELEIISEEDGEYVEAPVGEVLCTVVEDNAVEEIERLEEIEVSVEVTGSEEADDAVDRVDEDKVREVLVLVELGMAEVTIEVLLEIMEEVVWDELMEEEEVDEAVKEVAEVKLAILEEELVEVVETVELTSLEAYCSKILFIWAT